MSSLKKAGGQDGSEERAEGWARSGTYRACKYEGSHWGLGVGGFTGCSGGGGRTGAGVRALGASPKSDPSQTAGSR